MSQISKCPNITVILTYWEPSREVSELRYKSLLFDSSRCSYCISNAYKSRPSRSIIIIHPPENSNICVQQLCVNRSQATQIKSTLLPEEFCHASSSVWKELFSSWRAAATTDPATFGVFSEHCSLSSPRASIVEWRNVSFNHKLISAKRSFGASCKWQNVF